MEVTFEETTVIHYLPPENRMNFEIFDIMRERIRVNNMWLAVIKAIKQHIWRIYNPKIKRPKKIKNKTRLKDSTRYIIKQDMSP